MATFLVISSADDGSAGTLRQALADAQENEGADIIEFAPWLSGQTIRLQSTLVIQSGTLTINGDMDGDGDPDIIISGDATGDGISPDDVGTLVRVTAADNMVELKSLHFADGYELGEGGVVSDAAERSAFAGLYNAGTMLIENSIISNMRAYGGAGISEYGATNLNGGQASSGILSGGQTTVRDTLLTGIYANGGNGAGEANYDGGNGGRAQAGLLGTQGYGDGELIVERAGLANVTARSGGGGFASGASYTVGSSGDATAGVWIYSGDSSYTGAVGAYNIAAFLGINGPAVSGANPGGAGSTYFGTRPNGVVPLIGANAFTSGDDDSNTTGLGQFLFGFAGDDRLIDTYGGGQLYGGSGNDYILTGNSGASVYGGSGNDFIINSLVNTNTIMDGGTGIDLLDLSRDPGITVQLDMSTGVGSFDFGTGPLAFTARNFENFIGNDLSNFTDTIIGTNGANIVSGLAGNDILRGEGGDDQLFGGAGDDTLRGGNHNDILRGDADEDMLFGDNGNDLLFGGTENDTLRGGNNHDRLFGQGDNDMLFGDRGNDRLFGGDGDDTLSGGKNNDILIGGDGADIVRFAKGDRRDKFKDFEDNVDTVLVSKSFKDSPGQSKNKFLAKYATLKGNGDVIISMGPDKLTIEDVGSINALKNDFGFF